jgi:hypothetical protein
MNDKTSITWEIIGREKLQEIFRPDGVLTTFTKGKLGEKISLLLNKAINNPGFGFDKISDEEFTDEFTSHNAFHVYKNRLNSYLLRASSEKIFPVPIMLLAELEEDQFDPDQDGPPYAKYYLVKPRKGTNQAAIEDFLKQRLEEKGSSNTIELLAQTPDLVETPEQETSNPTESSIPSPPEYFFGRDEDLGNVKEVLGIGFRDEGQTIQVLTAMRGWPGVGKTSLAVFLAREPDVVKAFPDGILWVSLGPASNLIHRISRWDSFFGSGNFIQSRNLGDLKNRLKESLREKRMLLIVDDVWEEKHILTFEESLGPDCALLFTTRETKVADYLAEKTSIYNVPVLGKEASYQLLHELAPEATQDKDKTLELIDYLEYLPLAIHVAAGLLKKEYGPSWGIAELLIEIKKDASILLNKNAPKDYMDFELEELPTVAALIHKSIDRLDEVTRVCFAQFGEFAPKPSTFGAEDIKELFPFPNLVQVLYELLDRGLIEFDNESERFQMHSLLAMYAQSLPLEGE